ncbi:cytotoxic T-lymphocyte protein 4-like [Crotalus adamanteus]|uniref:Cytotoxic T-lymphocyte protein 4-like n=1 Tax=Crotalus adamanteus TaxID=8729 RepID=A0AAW1C8T2_CROAD
MISFLLTLVVYNIASGFTKVMEVTQPAFMVVKRPEAAHFECKIKNIGNAEDLKIERISPPPYYPVEGKGTQLLVIDVDSCPNKHLYLWILVPLASGLLGYSILIAIFIMVDMIRKKHYFSPGAYEKMIPM